MLNIFLKDHKMMTLKEAATLLNCSFQGDASIEFNSIANDSRVPLHGAMYAALKGTRYDGSSFSEMAIKNGASCILASKDSKISEDIAALLVEDTRIALCNLAKAWLSMINPWVLAIVGDHGKLNITQMVRAQFEACAPDVSMCTKGNFNNSVGLPLTLLAIKKEYVRAAVEMGSSHPGEIAELASIARPMAVVINHSLKDPGGKQGAAFELAKENGAAISALPENGIAILPKSSDFFEYWKELAGERRVVTFGINCNADINAVVFKDNHVWNVNVTTFQGNAKFCLGVESLNHVENAIGSLAAALCSGLDLFDCVKTLESFEPLGGSGKRCDLVVESDRYLIVDETYNCSKRSALDSIAMLSSLPGKKGIIIGNINDSKDESAMVDIALSAKKMGLSHLWIVGSDMSYAASLFGEGGQFFENKEHVWDYIQKKGLPAADVIALKASRSEKFELLLEKIKSLGRCSER